MDQVFKPYFDWFIIYIGDILVFSKYVDEHFKHLYRFKQFVKNSGLVVIQKKLEVFQTKIKFLGHIIEKGKITLQQHV